MLSHFQSVLASSTVVTVAWAPSMGTTPWAPSTYSLAQSNISIPKEPATFVVCVEHNNAYCLQEIRCAYGVLGVSPFAELLKPSNGGFGAYHYNTKYRLQVALTDASYICCASAYIT